MKRLLTRHPAYPLLLPGMAWLAIFFFVPLAFLLRQSLQEQVVLPDYTTVYRDVFQWSNFSHGLSTYRSQLIRSIEYAAVATLLAFAISYPLAYVIAFRGGRWKNLLLLLVVAPFFTNYLIRTIAWQTILADNGFVVSSLRSLRVLDVLGAFGIVSGNRVLSTPAAVVSAITYNYLPFMVLPLYVSLEKIDKRLLEAALDLYANRVKAFLRITFPLSLPGVFAGTLLTFIPAVGDYINAQLLGGVNTQMIGNVIQSKFLVLTDYPTAAALSFVMMAVILVLVIIYARVLGTEELTT
jgi:spermidine/putrescine transport system permease protein